MPKYNPIKNKALAKLGKSFEHTVYPLMNKKEIHACANLNHDLHNFGQT